MPVNPAKTWKESKMRNRSFFAVMPAFVLVLGLVLAGCPNGTTDGNSEADKVGSLPSFEGEFVGSEQDATTLASGADTQIQAAIQQALYYGTPTNSENMRAAVSESGRYEYNGISLDYTVTGDTSSNAYPQYVDITEVVSIDGTYNGYKIKGRYNLHVRLEAASQTESSFETDYDCWYTVSYNGKGMKVIATGTMNMNISGTNTSSSSITANMHYAVYDNDNVSRYDYNYTYP
jgi:hypothetical protein